MADFIDQFVSFMEGVPTPPLFKLWSAITCVSGALERRVWAETAKGVLFPNLFTMLVGPPGSGKCLEPNTPVLLHNGSTILAKDVKTGDCLLGPDGNARTVLGTAVGVSEMFKVIPVKGAAFICNDEHILSLRKSKNPNKGKLCNVAVKDWIKWSNNKKSEWKLWRSGEITFAPNLSSSSVDPYFLGLMLGDGSRASNCVSITTMEPEIERAINVVAHNWGLCVKLRISGNCGLANRFDLVSNKPKMNPLLRELKKLGLDCSCANRRVPDCIKYGSIENRLNVLAGLLDTDGHYHYGGYDFISKSKQLSVDVTFIARSLGLAAYVKKCQKGFKEFVGTYWRVSISGETAKIPCRVERKVAQKRYQIKDVTNTGFSVESLGVGDYAGFELDGDGLFLLGDFTVTHNTQAIERVATLWNEQQKLHIAPDSMTAAAMNDVLIESYQIRVDPKTAKPLTEYSSLSICADEFVVFCPAHDMEFLGRLTKIYDNPPSLKVRRKYIKEEINIVRPSLTMLTGTQPGILKSIFPEEAWSGGFTSRQIMIYEGEVPVSDMFAAEPEHPELRSNLKAHLAKLTTLYGKFWLDNEPGQRLNVWWKNGQIPKPQHSKLAYYNTRRGIHLLKLATISAASRDPLSMRITEYDMDRAFEWLFQAEERMPDIFRAMLGKSDADVLAELHYTMFALYEKRKRKEGKLALIDRPWIITFLSHRVPHEKILRIIDIAEQGRWITQVEPGFYKPLPRLGFEES